MATSVNNISESQKECCAVLTMERAIELLAEQEHISYQEALLRFTNSPVYEALFDYGTGVWAEGPSYLVGLYDMVAKKNEHKSGSPAKQ